jgi:hypothetical protein
MNQDRGDYADPPPPIWGSEPWHLALVLLALAAAVGLPIIIAFTWAAMFPIKENR